MKKNCWKSLLSLVLLALGGASVSWFLAQPVAGQETAPGALHGAAAIEQLRQTGQYTSLQSALQQVRLSVSQVADSPLGRAAWRAPNPAAGYDAYITESGVSIAANRDAYVSLSLRGIGYGNALRAVAPGRISGDQQSITIERPGGVREWFVNGADGLEHGFTLAAPPGARQKDVPLRLALQVSTGWQAVASENDQQVTLRDNDGAAVEYGKLVVRDNQGRNIKARLTVASGQVVIEVEDRDAQYPLTIDPLFTLQQRLLAADGAAEDYLGFAVALDGNTALVGAPYDDLKRGAAYVFVRNGTTWTQQAKLTAQDGTSFDYFGWSVALKGDTALVGALYGPGSLHPEQGAAYVFIRGGTTWSFQQKLTANENTHGAQFGAALALDGDTVLVGAPSYTSTPSFADIGAVFVFTRSGATWTQQARLNANDGEDGDSFGVTVALEGDTALIGAPNNAITFGGQGAAYVFTRSGTTWMQQQRLLAVQPAADDHFGNAVTLSGNKALIGAYLWNLNNGVTQIPDCGAVYTFVRGAMGWAQVSQFSAPNPTAGAQFGVAVALSGDTAVVGAARGLFQPGAEQRSAYVFENLGEWALVRQFGSELGAANDGFGYAVALSGDTLAAGAAYAKIGTNFEQGAAYVFVRSGTTWTQQQKLTANNGAAYAHFGFSLALTGDSLAIGAPGRSVGADALPGAAYVFTRTGVAWTQLQKLTGTASTAGDNYGLRVALSGDQLVVGAPGEAANKGAAYVYTRLGNWYEQQKLTAGDGATGDNFGFAVALSGDTVAVGAESDGIGNNAFQGSAYVFVSPACPVISVAPATLSNGVAGVVYTQPLTENGGGVGEYALSVSRGALPPGLTLSSVPGRLSGTPTMPGIYRFTITATFALSGCTGSREYTLTIAPCPTITISPPTLPAGVVGAMYNREVSATGGTGQHSFAVTTGSLPPGLTLTLFGVLSGTPAQAGVYNFTVTATSNTCTAARTYTLTILATCPTLTVTPSLLPIGAVGATYSQTVNVTGGVAPYTFALNLGSNVPPGLSFINGVLSGTPTQAGTYSFTVRIRDANNCPASQGYSVTINPPCEPITINPFTLPSGTIGTAYSQILTANVSALSINFTVTVGALPPGLSLSAAGVLSGTPTQAGSFPFTVTVSANGCQGTRAYTLTINDPTINSGLQFYPLPHPVRLLDTRPGQTGCDAPGTPIPGNTSRTQLARRSCDGVTIPANAKAITGNITTVQSDGGYLTLYPSDAAQPPLVANTNYAANEVLNNVFTVGLGAGDGAFKIFAVNNTHVVVDVTGYYAPPSASGLYFHPLPKPVRLLDTRSGAQACFTPGAPLPQGSNTPQLGQTTCDGVTIPAGARALVGNATTVNPQNFGYLTLYPADAAQPLVASSNFAAGQAMNVPFTVGLASGGFLNLFTTATTDLVVDVLGYYSAEANDVNGVGLLFNPLPAPVRLLETRAGFTGCYTPGAPLAAVTPYTQAATGACINIPATARGLIGNATVVNAQAGYLTFWPSNAAQPLVANSNYLTGQVFNRHFTLGLGADGAFKLFASGQTDLVIDVAGYFAP